MPSSEASEMSTDTTTSPSTTIITFITTITTTPTPTTKKDESAFRFKSKTLKNIFPLPFAFHLND